LVEDECEMDSQKCIEDSIDTYLYPEISNPGKNEAKEDLMDAILEIDAKYNIGGEDEEQKDLEFTAPLYF
jgi:hypothetical protein